MDSRCTSGISNETESIIFNLDVQDRDIKLRIIESPGDKRYASAIQKPNQVLNIVSALYNSFKQYELPLSLNITETARNLLGTDTKKLEALFT